MIRAAATIALAACLVAPALGQEEIDADYRVYDTIYLKDVAEPIVGTILERSGGEVTIRKQGSNIVFTKRNDEVADIVPRQTPEEAYRERAKRLGDAGDAALHRRLGEWCLDQSLIQEAEAQVALAAKQSPGPEGLDHRVRLAELLLARFPEDADAPGAGEVYEQLLATVEVAGEGAAPLLDLAQAKVALAIGLSESALAPLERARDGLEALAAGPPADDDTTPAPAASPSDAPPNDDDSTGPRYGRDGEQTLDPRGPRWDDRPRAGQPAAADAEDRSAELLAGLPKRWHPAFEEVYRTLARLQLEAGQTSAAERSYARLREVWPEHALAAIGLARTQIVAGQREAARETVNAALQSSADDPRLRLLSAQLAYLARELGSARTDLEAAARALADAADSRLVRRVHTTRGLVELLDAKLDAAAQHLALADADPGYGPARLALGVLAECRGDAVGARQHYEEALRLYGGNQAGEVNYALAWLLAETGDAAGAERELRRAVQDGYDLRLALTAMLELAQRNGDSELVGRVSEALVRAAPSPRPALLAALGRSYVEQGRLSEAEALFRRGLEQDPKHLPSLRGMAYCAYSADDRESAADWFQRILALAPDDAWAAAGQRNLVEAQTRRFWADPFEQAQVDASWSEHAEYGVRIKVESGRLVFSGPQANSANGKTMVSRVVKGEQLVRVEAAYDMGPGDARAGLRWQAEKGATVVLFHDFDGKVRYSWQRNARSGWEDPVELCDWPGTGAHVLAIDLVDPKQGQVEFSVDGQLVGQLKLAGRPGDDTVSLYVQGRKLGHDLDVAVDEVRLYVHRDAPRQRGGGF